MSKINTYYSVIGSTAKDSCMRIIYSVFLIITFTSCQAIDIVPPTIRYGVSAALGVWVSYKLQRMPSLRVQYTQAPETSRDDAVQITLAPYQYNPSEPHTCNRAWAAFTGIAVHFIVDSLVRNFVIMQNRSFLAYLIGKNSCSLSRMIYYAPFIADRAVSDSFFYDLGSTLESVSSIIDNIPNLDSYTYCR